MSSQLAATSPCQFGKCMSIATPLFLHCDQSKNWASWWEFFSSIPAYSLFTLKRLSNQLKTRCNKWNFILNKIGGCFKYNKRTETRARVDQQALYARGWPNTVPSRDSTYSSCHFSLNTSRRIVWFVFWAFFNEDLQHAQSINFRARSEVYGLCVPLKTH